MPDNDERLPVPIQESIVTAIAFASDDNAAFITSAVDVTLLDTPLNDIAVRCTVYRKRYQRPPGREHIEDVFVHVLGDKGHKSYAAYQRVLTGMLRLERNLNTRFIADSVFEFNRRRNQRIAIAQAAKIYQDSPEDASDVIDGIFRESLKATHLLSRNTGFTLAQTEALRFLDRSSGDFCRLGIDQFDQIGLHPAKKEMLLFIAARNRGKSFFCTHCGKMALLKGWKVVHYTLENSPEMTAQRYFQTLYSGVKRAGDYHYTTLAERDRVVDLRTTLLKPDFVIENRNATEQYLGDRMASDYFLDNLRIKSFPTGKLSFDMLERDLDEMSLIDRFQMDMVVIDYPQMMQYPRGDDPWVGLEELTIQLRGSAVERDYALVIPQQGTRSAEASTTVYGYHGGGSIAMLAVADNAITYSQTEAEEKHGLARLYAQKVRNDTARQTLVISQHYPSGQFCLSSQYMSDDLRAKINAFTGYQEDSDDPDKNPLGNFE